MNDITKWTFLLQIASTLAMVGFIWFVQIVHYPLFALVGRDGFRRYEMDHQRLTTSVVAPLMLTELVTAILLLWWRPAALGSVSLIVVLGLLVSIWIMTYKIQVPLHASLVMSFDASTHRRLVSGNWSRTLAWSARGALVLWMASQTIHVVVAHQ